MFERLNLTLKKVFTYRFDPRYSRLSGDIAAYEPQLQKRINELGEESDWAIQAKLLLAKAKEFCEEYKIDEGWKCLHAAKRYEFFAMGKHERRACAISLLKEAEKLNEWRKNAIISILSESKEKKAKNSTSDADPKTLKGNLILAKDKVSKAPSAEVLFQAADLKDDDYNNQYYLNRLSRNLFWLLSGLLFLVMIAIVIYFIFCIKSFDTAVANKLEPAEFLIGIILFGFLGALTSAILFTRNMSRSSRIKELCSSQVIVMSKIFIGVGFSVFIFLLLRSSFADTIKIFSFSISNPIDYFAIAFASGFTERLAQKSLKLLIGNESPEKGKTAGV